MIKKIILIANIIWHAFYSYPVLANLNDKCLPKIPMHNKFLVNSKSNSLPLYIKSEKVMANYPKYIIFSDHVNIKQGNNTLSADKVQLTQQQTKNNILIRTINAKGHVKYLNDKIQLQGSQAWSNLTTQDANIYQGKYQILVRQGRGNADIMKQRYNNRFTILKNSSFTSCLLGDDSWNITGSKIIHDYKKKNTKIYNARFKFKKIPIFYIPYLQIPEESKHHPELFISNIKYSKSNGLEFSIPYYLNIASHYDVTITPNYISKLGTQIKTEFRYPILPGEGVLGFDWLPKGNIFNTQYNNNCLWLLHWRHYGILDRFWRFNIYYTKVNNPNYFNILKPKYSNITNSYATQKISIGYSNKNWDTEISYKHFQLFNFDNIKVYGTYPQINLTYFKNDINHLHFQIFTQACRFINIDNNYPKAIRLHIEPTFNLSLYNNWGNLDTEVKLLATHYFQENIDKYNNNITTNHSYLKKSVNRVLPQFKTTGKIIFERYTNSIFNHLQTLEPCLQYRYTPYRNQNNIGIYDSSDLQISNLQTYYYDFFYNKNYSGLDRIPYTNQLNSSITTRIYNNKHIEQFNASVSQICYFLLSKINHRNSILNKDHNTDITWGGDSYWRINNTLGIYGNIQYSSTLNNIRLGNTTLEYKRGENRILQLNYRYVSPGYMEGILPKNQYSNYQQYISQLGIIGDWPIINNWSLVAAYYYSSKINQTVNQLIGLQYNTCCCDVNLGYELKISERNNNYSSQYDKKIFFNIELRGLNKNNILKVNRILNFGSLPYQQLY